jgi:UPF0716 protein FxsA
VWVTREFATQLNSSVWVWFGVAALVGLALIRYEGLSFRARFMAALTAAVSQDTNPWRSVVNSARKVVAGILFILPGVMSDVAAIAILLVPLNVAARLVPAWLPSAARTVGGMSGARSGPRTLDGSYRRVD